MIPINNSYQHVIPMSIKFSMIPIRIMGELNLTFCELRGIIHRMEYCNE
jgi:hypothetical protein